VGCWCDGGLSSEKRLGWVRGLRDLVDALGRRVVSIL
jgi:hypothetical protein